MSTLKTDLITRPDGKPLLRSSGSVIQTVLVRSDVRTTYSVPAGTALNGTTLSALNISITPRESTSLLIITFNMHIETDEQTCYLMHQNGTLITTSGYEGYNNEVGNNAQSCLQTAPYDAANNNTTTPHHQKLTYYGIAGSTSARTYAPAVRSSINTAQTLYFNRAGQNTGDNGDEVGVSFGRILEIAQ